MPEKLEIRFDGGLASGGQLDFYDYGRSQYALARFVATVEHFRRTGIVTDKISGRSHVELLITVPEKGSFLQDVLVQTAAGIFSGSFLAILAYAWHALLPRREKTDDTILEVAKLKLAIEQQRTLQAREVTKQTNNFREIAEGRRATAKEALELLKWSQSAPYDAAATLNSSPEQRVDMLREIEAELGREHEFADAEEGFKSIDEVDLLKLTSRLRAIVPDMALPLRSSATRMTLGSSKRDSGNIIHLTDELVQLVKNRTPEEVTSDIVGRVKSYDRDSGVGKVQSDDLPRILNFVVPRSIRTDYRDIILAAMRRNLVTLRCRKVLDESGMPTSLILLDVILDENEPVSEE